MSEKTIEERYSEWLAILPRGTTVNPYKAWVAAFEREVAPLRKRLVEAMSIVKEMDCECGFETGSEESYLPAICFKHLLYEILDSETHKPLEEKK